MEPIFSACFCNNNSFTWADMLVIHFDEFKQILVIKFVGFIKKEVGHCC